MKNRLDDNRYKIKLKNMRQYSKKLRKIDMRKKLTSANKRQITIAYNEYKRLTSRPHKIYRGRKKQNINLAQKFSGHETKTFDVAFIHTASPKAKIIIDKTGLTIQSGPVREKTLLFNRKNLLKNPKKEIARIVKQNPNAVQFMIQVENKYYFNGAIDPELVLFKVESELLKYSDPSKNNYWGNWLTGLIAIEFEEQAQGNAARAEYRQAKNKTKKKNNKLRRKIKKGINK